MQENGYFWEMRAVISPAHTQALRQMIADLAACAANTLGGKSYGNKLNGLSEILFQKGGFELVVQRKAYGMNTICPNSLTGGGVVLEDDGFHGLLFLFFLQKRFEQRFPSVKEALISFSDKDTNHFSFNGLSTLQAIAEDIKWDYSDILKSSEDLGLVVPVIDLSKIETDIEDAFF